MPIIFLTVKLPDGGLVHFDLDNKSRVEDFRTLIAPKVGVKRHRQRLVFAGRLMQDGRTLDSYGVERNSTIHLLHAGAEGAEGLSGIDIMQTPQQLGALQRHVLANPDILQQMLESPAMQNLLNDQDLLRSLVKMDPRLNKLLEGCPELQAMLSDPQFMNQASEGLRNPVHVRDILRSTDRSITALEALPNGAFDVFRQMCDDIKRPLMDEAWQAANGKNRFQSKKDKNDKEVTKKPEEVKKVEEVKPEGEEGEDGEDEEESEVVDDNVKQPPEWMGTFDPNAMASMMQDQNMLQLLTQLVQTMGGPASKLHPDDPFLDPSFIGQMFHSQTIQSMAVLQSSIEKLSLAADPDAKKTDRKKKGDKAEEPADSPAVLSGLHPTSPAANFKDSFALFVAAEQESPEVKYKGQLQAMQNMGFTDKDVCITMLHSCDGNMTKAVEMLMAQGGGK